MEGITVAKELRIAKYVLGNNIHLFKGSFYLCHQEGLLDGLKKWKPDSLVMEANPRYLSTSSAVKWMHQHNKPVIGWGLGAPKSRGVGGAVWTSFINQFDAMLTYSQRGADEYTALGFPRNKIFVAHNSVALPPSLPYLHDLQLSIFDPLFSSLEDCKPANALIRYSVPEPKYKI